MSKEQERRAAVVSLLSLVLGSTGENGRNRFWTKNIFCEELSESVYLLEVPLDGLTSSLLHRAS